MGFHVKLYAGFPPMSCRFLRFPVIDQSDSKFLFAFLSQNPAYVPSLAVNVRETPDLSRSPPVPYALAVAFQ